jgi:hypothetical protein
MIMEIFSLKGTCVDVANNLQSPISQDYGFFLRILKKKLLGNLILAVRTPVSIFNCRYRY